MKKIVALLCALLCLLNSHSQNKKVIEQAEAQLLKAISGRITEVKPDVTAKVLRVPLAVLTENCVDVVYQDGNPEHADFFKLTETTVDFKWTNATYSVTLTGSTELVSMKLLLAQFPQGTNMVTASMLLAPCYCLPYAYVLPFYTANGMFISFEPQLSHIDDTTERVALYNALQDYLIKTLPKTYTYQNVSLMNND